jgi:transcriptional regulator with XRE-family HTH domain
MQAGFIQSVGLTDYTFRIVSKSMENKEKNGSEKNPPNNIKELRIRAGLTLEQLAEKVDHSHGMIQHLETGRSSLTHKWMMILARGLNCDPEDFVMSKKKLAKKMNGDLVQSDAAILTALSEFVDIVSPENKNMIKGALYDRITAHSRTYTNRGEKIAAKVLTRLAESLLPEDSHIILPDTLQLSPPVLGESEDAASSQ